MQLVSASTDQRTESVRCIRQWGDLNTDAVLDSACKIFTAPGIEGLIGYRQESGYAVVFGDPVCAEADRPSLAQAFQQHCEQLGLGVIYVIISETFAQWASAHLSGTLIEYGEKLILNPYSSPMDNTGTKGSLVRRKVKQAIKQEVMVTEYTGDAPELESAIEEVGEKWLSNRSGAQIHISRFSLFSDRYGKRWIYARHGDHIVGVLVLNQLKEQQGWLMNHLMITPEAPNGTSEHMVITTLKILQEEGCGFVACGPVPAKQLGKITGLNKFTTWLVRTAYQTARKVYRLDGLNGFWEKFQPATQPSYLLFTKGALRLRGIKGLLKALNATL